VRLDAGYDNALTICTINGKYNPCDVSINIAIKARHLSQQRLEM
jgi:hypothetical protein